MPTANIDLVRIKLDAEVGETIEIHNGVTDPDLGKTLEERAAIVGLTFFLRISDMA